MMATRLRTLFLYSLVNLISSNSHLLHTYSSQSQSQSLSQINYDSILCQQSSPNKCTINCSNEKYCINKIITCPSNGKCEINCHFKHSCFNTTIIANSSNYLRINALYRHSTYNANIYCPSSQGSQCQIYGDYEYSLENINIHINSYQNHKIICQHSSQHGQQNHGENQHVYTKNENENKNKDARNIGQCAHHGSMQLYCDNHQTKCKLSNTDYQCINNQFICINNNSNTHSLMRRLLGSPTTSTAFDPNATTTTSKLESPAMPSKNNEDAWPFGMTPNGATTAYILITAVILIICLFCCVMGLCCCMCRQQKRGKIGNRKIHSRENVATFTNNNSNSRHSRHSYNNSNDSIRLRYLVLAYENGKKIKIPFDLATLDHLGDEHVAILNSNHGSNISTATLINKNGRKQSSNGRGSNSNYLSDSLHAALSDENNKIVSAVIMDSNGSNDDLENSNQENTTVAPLALGVIENGMDTSNKHSPIDVIMEDDTDLMQSGNGNHRYLASDDDNLISPNANTKLIKVGTKNPQRIVQSSVSFTNSMEYGYKKYKTRQDSGDLHLDENKETEFTSSTTLTSSSHGSEIEMQLQLEPNDKLNRKPSLNNDDTKTFDEKSADPNDDRRVLHHQSSSQPHVLKTRNNKYNQNRPRPKTAHPMSPRDDEELWNRQNGKNIHNHIPKKQKLNPYNTNSTHLSSWDSDTTLTQNKNNDHRLKKYVGRQLIKGQNGGDNDEEILPMKTSTSVPMNHNNSNMNQFPNMRNVKFVQNPNLKAPSKAISTAGDLTPSRKGLRRTPNTLPKPLPKRVKDNQDDENNEEKLPLTQQKNANIVITKRYINAKTMAYQMTMHHQSHQRTLQPRQRSTTNGNVRTSPSPPPNINAQQYPPPIVRQDPGLNRKNIKYHRHMSEPHIPSTYDGPPFTPPTNMSMNVKVKYHQHHRNDIINNPNDIDNKSYKSSPNHLPEHHPNPRQTIHGVHGHISYPDSPGPESPPIAYADITDNENLSSPPMIPIQFEEHSRTESTNSRIRSRSHPAKPVKSNSPLMNGNISRNTDEWADDADTGFIINNGYINANQTPVDDNQSPYHPEPDRHRSKSPKSPKRKKSKHKRDKDKKRKKRERKMAIAEDPSDDDGTLLTHKSHKTSKTTKTYQSKNRHKKSNNKYPNRDRKRKASTPTPNARDKRKHRLREREKGGSDKLHRRAGMATQKINVSPIDQRMKRPNLKKKERDKNKLSPPNHTKNNKKRNGKSKSEPWQQYQSQSAYFGDPRRRKLQPEHSNASSHTANTNRTANTTHTFYTATTNSETPIPAEINPMTLSPINVGLVSKSPINGKINGQQGSPGKTTTISSAYVPPPPSPQLTKKRGNISTGAKSPPTMPQSQLSPTPPSKAPHHPLPSRPHGYHVHPPSPYQLPTGSETHIDLDLDPNRVSNNTDNTHTYDDGTRHQHEHRHNSQSTLSQDTANSNTNTRSRVSGPTATPTRTPTRDLSANSNTKTVTFRNAKYGISPNSTVLTKSPPQPSLDALHSGKVMAVHTHTLSPQTNVTYSPDGVSAITVNGLLDTNSPPQQRYRIRVEGANTHTTTNTTTDCNTTSSETNSDDGDDDDSTESTQSSESESEFDGVNTSETRKLMEKSNLIKNKNQHHLQYERKHYIVGSMDSDGKTMFGIPPVPMQVVHPHHEMPLHPPQQMIINQSMETNYGTQSSEQQDDEYKEIPSQNPYDGRQLRPLPDTDSIGTISPDWRQYQQYNHEYTINKLKRLKFKNHRSGSSNHNDGQSQYMATISTVTKTPSPEDSHNDEEKAYAPSQPGNNPYLLEPKKNSNSQSGSGSKTIAIENNGGRHNNNNNNNDLVSMHSSQPSNHYNHDFNEKEYIFAQHLEDTIKTLTKSDRGSDNDDHQFLEQESFIKMTENNNIWQQHGNINDGYVE